MKITGIIAEYNPLHNGHVYHMEQARLMTGSNAIIVVMSGDFVQRGEPALADKYSRATAALKAGADAVFELPVRYACGSAESFAAGGIAVLNALGSVDSVAFGCEDANLQMLAELARYLANEPSSYRSVLQENLRIGMNFAKARSEAVTICLGEAPAKLLSRPNNILAVEYLKALYRSGSSIAPCAIPRTGSGHNESASAIRQALLHSADVSMADLVPPCSLPGLEQPMFTDDFSPMLLYRIRSLSVEELAEHEDVSLDLARAIKRESGHALSFTKLVEALSSKNYTVSRIRRALLHILLQAKAKEALNLHAIRLIGFRRDTLALRIIQDSSAIPIITKTADAPGSFLDSEIFASDVYRIAYRQKYGISLPDEFHAGPVIV